MDPLIIIAGPTAVGKTDLSLRLSKLINGSVISCDSMQVYKGMDIGTAKVTSAETDGIPHYLIDVLDPFEEFNIVMFKDMATQAIKDIYAAGRIPVMVGGTGFYIQSVLYDISFDETDDDQEYRDTLTELIKSRGNEYVHGLLQDIDPEAAKNIHHNDHKRLIRALEYHKQTGRLISEHNRNCSSDTSPYDFCYFFIEDDRKKIYERIDERVDEMLRKGLVDEVKGLLDRGLTRQHVSMQGLGYKEIIDHLEGKISLDEAVYRIKRDSRHFAKRQITWSKREKDIIRINISEDEDVLGTVLAHLEEKGIINGRSC